MKNVNACLSYFIKYLRGVLSLYLLGMSFLVLVFVINSCQNDTELEPVLVKEVVSKYKRSVENVSFRINNEFLNQSSGLDNDSSSSIKMISETEKELSFLVEGLLKETKVFLNSLGVPEDEYLGEFSGNNDLSIVLIGLAVLASYEDSKKSYEANQLDITKVFYSECNAQTENKIVNCFLEATGISAGIAAVGVFTGMALSKTQLLKLVKKLAKTMGKRALGVIGLAFIVGEFSWCMSRSQ